MRGDADGDDAGVLELAAGEGCADAVFSGTFGEGSALLVCAGDDAMPMTSDGC